MLFLRIFSTFEKHFLTTSPVYVFKFSSRGIGTCDRLVVEVGERRLDPGPRLRVQDQALGSGGEGLAEDGVLSPVL
jgi:hypothetical protein